MAAPSLSPSSIGQALLDTGLKRNIFSVITRYIDRSPVFMGDERNAESSEKKRSILTNYSRALKEM